MGDAWAPGRQPGRPGLFGLDGPRANRAPKAPSFGSEHRRARGVRPRLQAIPWNRPGRPGAVEDLSLEVPAGAVCVLVGPSGCGKTTSLKMVNRLIEPTSGRILIDGADVPAT